MNSPRRTECETLTVQLEGIAEELCRADIFIKPSVAAECERMSDALLRLKQMKGDENMTEAFWAVADRLDDAGVRIWNRTIKRTGARDTQPPEALAHLRTTAFALLELAAPSDGEDVRVLAKMARLALKIGKSWLDSGDFSKATMYYETASNFLERGSNGRSRTTPKELRTIGSLMLAYKAELEFRQNESAVSFMLMRQASQPESLSSFTQRELEEVSRICIQCARQASKSIDAIQWCKLGIDLIENPLNAGKESEGGLKRDALLFLSNLYLETNGVEAAEKAIDLTLEGSPNLIVAYHLKLRCLAQRGQSEHIMQEVFATALENCSDKALDGKDFDIVLGIIHLIARSASPIAAVNGINAILRNHPSKTLNNDYQDKLRILRLYFLTNGSDHYDAALLSSINDCIDEATQNEGTLELVYAYRLLLWQVADKATQDSRWEDAANLFKCSARLLLGDIDKQNRDLVRKKLAVCYLELRKPRQAYESLQIEGDLSLIPADMNFLAYAALMEGNNDVDAYRHITAIECTEETIKLFICAAQLAYKKEDKGGLQRILKQVISSSVDWIGDNKLSDLMTVIRCLIRLTKALLTAENKETMTAELLAYFGKSLTLLRKWKANSTAGRVVDSEAEWLYRSSWNVALTAASQGLTEVACELFAVTSEFMDLFDDQNLHNLETQKMCLFAVVAGHISLARKPTSESDEAQHLTRAMDALQRLRTLCQRITALGPAASASEDPVLQQSIYLELEIKVKQESWTDLEHILEFAEAVEAPVQVFERMADIVTRHDCPSAVVFMTIQATLNTILKRDPAFDMRKFSQWFRILIRTSLVANKAAAFGLYQQVLTILRSNSQQETSYPKHEVEWLMVTAWNHGCEFWRWARRI
ncbi:uncharacterized protein EV422DRAFT_366894 [Fimicolochytrium jonesii]|uniref:uncharacterized protein n=1 Tax=Fimicolochytrium jonesii TaxID=1396493 RepID=UPI0022FED1B6|nr:uncharacterized protein EV422DRAFT_366894 [Fimicolochytrium jonesii]KAI8823705.1 hypothetical protein EV422DRAFT_366894 [Fimicolochytrium jonesii]